MLSKITIDFGDDHKPLIKVKEASSSPDVRDRLLRSFRQLLNSDSMTLRIEFEPSDFTECNYNIYPVTNEIHYFRSFCERLLGEKPTDDEFKYLDDFFNWISDKKYGQPKTQG